MQYTITKSVEEGLFTNLLLSTTEAAFRGPVDDAYMYV